MSTVQERTKETRRPLSTLPPVHFESLTERGKALCGAPVFGVYADDKRVTCDKCAEMMGHR